MVNADFTVRSDSSLLLVFREAGVDSIRLSELSQALLAPAVLPRTQFSMEVLHSQQSPIPWPYPRLIHAHHANPFSVHGVLQVLCTAHACALYVCVCALYVCASMECFRYSMISACMCIGQ